MIFYDYVDAYLHVQALSQEADQLDDYSLIDEVTALSYEESYFYEEINDAINSHFIGSKLTEDQRKVLKSMYVLGHFNLTNAIHPGIL